MHLHFFLILTVEDPDDVKFSTVLDEGKINHFSLSRMAGVALLPNSLYIKPLYTRVFELVRGPLTYVATHVTVETK